MLETFTSSSAAYTPFWRVELNHKASGNLRTHRLGPNCRQAERRPTISRPSPIADAVRAPTPVPSFWLGRNCPLSRLTAPHLYRG